MIPRIGAKHNRQNQARTHRETECGQRPFRPYSCPSSTFYIGGYQSAQKWLEERKGRALCFDKVTHDRKIMTSRFETDRIMRPIAMDLTAG